MLRIAMQAALNALARSFPPNICAFGEFLTSSFATANLGSEKPIHLDAPASTSSAG